MSKEKQIDEKHELSESIYMSGHGLDRKDSDDIAEQLYHEGYRKQREARYCADPNYRTLGNCGECGGDVTCLNNYCPNCGAKLKGV